MGVLDSGIKLDQSERTSTDSNVRLDQHPLIRNMLILSGDSENSTNFMIF